VGNALSLNSSANRKIQSTKGTATKEEFQIKANRKLLQPEAYQNNFEPLPISLDPYRGI